MRHGMILLALGAVLAMSARAEDDPATLFEHGQLRRAAAACERRLAAGPDAAASAILARVRIAEGRVVEAQKLAETAVEQAPRSALAHVALAQACGAHAQKANVLQQPGLARRCRREGEAALAIEPANADACDLLVQFHLMAPGVVGGDRKRAQAVADALVAADPAMGWLLRARIAGRTDTTQVGPCLQRAADATPVRGEARLALAQWLAQPPRGRTAQAEALARTVAATEPWRVGAHVLLAGFAAHDGRWAALDSVLATADRSLPDSRLPWYVAGRTLVVDRREPERAIRYLRHYLERDSEPGAPGAGGAHWRIGLAREQLGRRDEALVELRTAVRLQPDLADAKRDLKRLGG